MYTYEQISFEKSRRWKKTRWRKKISLYVCTRHETSSRIRSPSSELRIQLRRLNARNVREQNKYNPPITTLRELKDEYVCRQWI